MGDGGVACVTSQHIAERFPVAEKPHGVIASLLPVKSMRELERKVEKVESVSEGKRRKREDPSNSQLENGEFMPESKGELEKGEFVPERHHRGELERGEVVHERQNRWESSLERRRHGKEDSGQRSNKSSKSWRESNSGTNGDMASEKKHDGINGRSHQKEPENWLRRHSGERDGGGRNHHRNEHGEYSSSRSRRVSEDSRSRSKSRQAEYVDKLNKCSDGLSPSGRKSFQIDLSGTHHRGHSRHGRSPESKPDGSPSDRNWRRDRRERSPHHLEKSPRMRARQQESRDKTPVRLERSPRDRSRRHDHVDRSAGNSERSPRDRCRHRYTKDRMLAPRDNSSCDRALASSNHHEDCQKGLGNERKRDRYEDRHGRRVQDSIKSMGHSPSRLSKASSNAPEKRTDHTPHKEIELNGQVTDFELPLPPPPPLPESPLPPPPPPLPPSLPIPPQANDMLEEQPSMEEDMDICDTPPHTETLNESDKGKWYYLDHLGIERGPSRLVDLKRLVDDGVLLSDHLIKHLDSDRWVLVENAASPLVHISTPLVASDAVTQMVTPPEPSGNLLNDEEDMAQELNVSPLSMENDANMHVLWDDSQFDARIGVLLDGFDIIPGKELEKIGEALGAAFTPVEWENWGQSEGFNRSTFRTPRLHRHLSDDDFARIPDLGSKEPTDTRKATGFDRENNFLAGESVDSFTGRWSCKGGDWKRNEDGFNDRGERRKVVLNDGYPLCQMPKCGYEDPRWHRKDDLYHASCKVKLELPSWAYSWTDDIDNATNDMIKNASAVKACQTKQNFPRVTKGIMLPVIRINACVVTDPGYSILESHSRMKSIERHPSRTTRSSGGSYDRNSTSETTSRKKKYHENDLHRNNNLRASFNIPKDRLCNKDELSLQLGDWYYLDGATHECGPFFFSELKELVCKGAIIEGTSVFRKMDNLWVPVTVTSSSSVVVDPLEENGSDTKNTFVLPLQRLQAGADHSDAFSSFHISHPQFMGFMCGKLHELVMKSYKSREFATAINGVLDPWLNAKQPKELDKHTSNYSITRSSAFANEISVDKFWGSDDEYRSGKHARLMTEGSEDDDIAANQILQQIPDYPFEDLDIKCCLDDIFNKRNGAENWGLLDPRLLARVFHFLRGDIRSLIFASVTCKHWNSAVNIYRGVSRHADFSSAGPRCTDSIFQSLLGGFDSRKLSSVSLASCINISPGALLEVLRLFPGISAIDVRGCDQFEELISHFDDIKWIKNLFPQPSPSFEDGGFKSWSFKQLAEKSYYLPKLIKSNFLDVDDENGNIAFREFNLDRKGTKGLTFRQGCYRRTKLTDARRSLGAQRRNAQLKQLIRKKSENDYRILEPLIKDSLRNIMKENSFSFLVPKVAEIEERMKTGYYVRYGLISIKEDIRHMCRNVIKAKRLFRREDMNRIISPFLQLVKRLEKPMQHHIRDAFTKTDRNCLDTEVYYAERKKKKQFGISNDKRHPGKMTTAVSGNDLVGSAHMFEHDLKRSLSKLNRNIMNSEGETSDDDLTDGYVSGEGETTESDSESDLELRSEFGKVYEKDVYLMLDEAMYITDDRDWGARMTKASLVPPVTRKYEVIDHYLVVADEIEVQRKMTVALPEDYEERVNTQRNGIDDSDMEIPEVQVFKPRKLLGEEVVEQEVYGIDPYTHNLLLDTMPRELEWTHGDKHQFIEEVLLRTLNRQVRLFTGSGNAPMIFQLHPVVEEVKKAAEEDGDAQTMKLCQALLKAMRNRPDDNYVAYRKGLGVICNKETGFCHGDFIVEFLGEVYPSWRWYEKQDGIRSLQENSKDPLPEFYNINLERPKGDRDGYDLVVVDAMHKANYASRICHSCRPNCEAKVTAVNGKYQIGIYTVRPIAYGEEITFDYNSVTESKEEYEASVCLCGSQVCRGSYLNLTGEEAFQNILKDAHGILNRHKLMIEACEVNSVSEEDYIELGRAGLGSCLLDGLPDWLIAYSANLVRFINFERTKLPNEILKHNYEEKMKYIPGYNVEDDRPDAEVQAEGVYNQRLQNMAITIDKVKYVMRSVYGDPARTPPPVERLSPEAVVSVIWKGEGSVIDELLKCLSIYIDSDTLNDLKSNIRLHDPSDADDVRSELQKSLLWLRDELRDLPCSHKCRNDAAADLIHMYAYTRYFFRVKGYKSFTSPPVHITPQDMGPKYAEKMPSGFHEYCKTYGENYCLGQLIYWHNQTNADPDQILTKAGRGCLVLPDISSFYVNNQNPTRRHIYGAKTLSLMFLRMEKQPQRPWPKDQIWVFNNSPKFFGSPMLDAMLSNCSLDRDMMHWLRNRPAMFQGARDG